MGPARTIIGELDTQTPELENSIGHKETKIEENPRF